MLFISIFLQKNTCFKCFLFKFGSNLTEYLLFLSNLFKIKIPAKIKAILVLYPALRTTQQSFSSRAARCCLFKFHIVSRPVFCVSRSVRSMAKLTCRGTGWLLDFSPISDPAPPALPMVTRYSLSKFSLPATQIPPIFSPVLTEHCFQIYCEKTHSCIARCTNIFIWFGKVTV